MSQQANANVSETSPPPSYRVKVYCLDTTGKWEDKGTGFCVYLEGGGNDPDEIFVRSEIDSTPLLSSIVHSDRSYQKQQDTLIVWTELDKEDLALSFQDAESCEEIWLRIHSKKGGDEKSGLDESLDDDNDDVDTSIHVNETLPAPKLTNLGKISRILTSATVLHEKDELANFILTDGYVNKLFPIFESCENSKKTKKLHKLYTIMKSIILLKDSSVIECLMADDKIMNVAGMLEYDTSTPRMKANHRQVLEKQSQMELVVPLDDVTTLSKMRQTFRLQYLKDVILAKYLDETLTSMLQSLILFNHIDIIGHIQYNSKFLTDLFDILKRSDVDSIQKTKAVQFVLQLCSISKSLQSGARVLLFRTLARYGLFDAIEIALSLDNDGMHKAGVGALSSIVDMDVALLRTHILDQQTSDELEDTDDKKKDLLECILHRFTTAKDSGLKFQYGDILKMLLETNTNPPPGALSTSKVLRKQIAGIDDILGVFYEKYAALLLRPIQNIENKPMKLDGPIELLEFDQEQAEVYNHLLDFLCFAIQQHGFRSKYFMLSSDCFPKVAQLYRSRQSWIKLSALRFFRTCVGLLDDFFNRHLIKHNIFESTIRVLLDTDGKANLLNSACLELLEFIRSENPKLLVTHLIERFGSVLDTVDYIPTCSLLRQQYDENQERSNTSTSLTLSDNYENG
ncbi:component of IIS longevity pathway SMK-1-domain-containing protein [Absidia repens]|uniref:Component of IIS longevity pathway SMK-1-domain-containing protein n=1 Tax=Absidia repens TaxID=90262 RepID=A0A1X2IJX6_9FUNG|nr:component of IIS longevity pathway SMK-1-domain-containing protein [Absidia repens]